MKEGVLAFGPSPGAGIRLLGRRRTGGWIPAMKEGVLAFGPSPGAGIRLLGRRRNGG